MSERYNVAASAVLGENYEITNIECSDYNPNIDSTITVTVSVDDVYGDAVSGETVTVTASEGNFTQLNGSDITSASTVTGTTNSSGQFTLTYACSVWGLITFTANNKTAQVKVGGYKTTTPHSYYTIYEYEDKVGVKISISDSINFTTSWRSINGSVIPYRLRPQSPVTMVGLNAATGQQNIVFGVRESADHTQTEIIVKSLSGSSISTQLYNYIEWSKV